MLYYMPYINDNSIYSVDGMRIKFRLCHDVDPKQVLQFLGSHSASEYYQSSRSYTFSHLFIYHLPFTSFKVGFGMCGLKDKDLEGFLEFNPNKVLGYVNIDDGFVQDMCNPFSESVSHDVMQSGRDLFWEVHQYLFDRSKRFELLRFDFAVDLMVLRTEVQLLKDSRKYAQFRKSNLDLTEYLGCRSSGGYVKVYNKTLESELDYDCTRLEITLDDLEYSTLCRYLPRVVISRSVDFSGDVLAELLSRLPVDEFDLYFRRLGRRLRDKYSVLVSDQFQVPEHVHAEICGVAESFLKSRIFLDPGDLGPGDK